MKKIKGEGERKKKKENGKGKEGTQREEVDYKQPGLDSSPAQGQMYWYQSSMAQCLSQALVKH